MAIKSATPVGIKRVAPMQVASRELVKLAKVVVSFFSCLVN